METRPPTITRILVATGFVLSCFGIALFLWLAFGGPIPLKPESYRFEVPVTEATQLAEEADVRISGVPVGKVKRVDLDDTGTVLATVEMDPRYAPIPSDTRASLRLKTLLGETYVELTPGSNEAEPLPEGGRLPAAQVAESVQLDEIFRTFDERTRNAFRAWMQGSAAALRGRGQDLSTALASLDTFASEADKALRILDSQKLAVNRLISSGGEVFEALSERPGQLRGLIENTNAVFEVTARRNRSLEELFTVLPTFLRESRLTLNRLDRFAADSDPVVSQLRQAARELGPTIRATTDLAGELDLLWPGLRRAIDNARPGFGALRGLLGNELPPLLGRLDPFLNEVTPIFTGLRQYRREVTGFLGNATAVTNATNDEGSGPRNYLRTLAVFSPEMLAAFPRRLRSDRTNPYIAPGAYDLRGGLASFSTSHCADGINARLDPNAASNPDFNSRTGGDPDQAQDFLNRLEEFVFTGQPDSNSIPAPACRAQGPFASIGAPAEATQYQHVNPLP